MEPRAYLSGAAGTPPEFPSTSVSGYPQSATTTLPATIPGPYWYYMVGEEVRNFIISTGQIPDPFNQTQLLQGIINLLGSK